MRWVDNWAKTRAILVLLVTAANLVACGGGGSDTSNPTPPVVTAGRLIAAVSTASGAPAGLVLQTDGRPDLNVTATGDAVFAGAGDIGQWVTVVVKQQPAGMVCSVGAGPTKLASSDLRVPVSCVSGVPMAGSVPKPAVVGGPGSRLTLAAGYKTQGVMEVLRPLNSTTSYRIDAQHGVLQNLRVLPDGRVAYEVSAEVLSPGTYPFAMRLTDISNGSYQVLEGSVVVSSPVAQGKFNVTRDGGEFVLDAQRKLVVRSSNLDAPVGMAVAVVRDEAGHDVVWVKFDRDVSASALHAQLQFASAPKSSYPLAGDDSIGYFASARQTILSLARKGLQSLGLAATGTTSIYTEPYAAASTLPEGVTKPMVANGLGQLWIQGPNVAFDNGFLTQGLFNVTKTTEYWLSKLNVGGYDAAQAQAVLDDQKIWAAPRFWDDVHLTPMPEGALNIFSDFFQQYSITLSPAYEVHTSIKGDPALFDWANHEPVLFVHGFSPSIGGGAGTWSKFPKLAMATPIPSRRTLVPFEFHWRTNQSFRLAADDLADTIERIHKASGQPVHIVAHSFGGVLTRTVLQKASRSGKDVSGKVASLVTLGSPHSGIADVDQIVDGTAMPAGQDSASFEGCWQVSCFEMGEPVSWGVGSTQADYGLTGGYAKQGKHPAVLYETRERLPDLPIFVGIGLTVAVTKPDLTPLAAPEIGQGDNLISFAGQRFLSGTTTQAAAAVLLDGAMVGQARVTEMILGLPIQVRPGQTISKQALPTTRSLGYLHSGLTGASSVLSVFNLFAESWRSGRGVMAAPSYECDVPSLCVHAGYQLFRQAVGTPLNLSNRELATAKLQGPLPLTPSVVEPAWTSTQRDELRAILRELYAKGVISGSTVRWELLSAAERRDYLGRLSFVPVPSGWQELYADQFSAIADFEADSLQDESLRAFGKSLMWSRDNAARYLSLINNAGKAFMGEAKVVYPAQAMAVEQGATIIYSTDANVVQVMDRFKLLSTAAPFMGMLEECGVGLGTQFSAGIDEASAHKSDVAAWLKLLTIPMDCLSAGFELGDLKERAKLAALISDEIALADGTKESVVTFLIETIRQSLDFLPNRPYKARAQGVMEVIDALWDSYVIGREFAASADRIFLVEADKIEAAVARLRAKLQGQRDMQWLSAKANIAFAHDPSGMTLAVLPSQPTVAQTVRLAVTEIWALARSVVVRFSDAVAAVVRDVLPDGTVQAVDRAFDAIGSFVAEVRLMAESSGAGKLLGFGSVTITVGAPTPAVADVSPTSATAGVLSTFDVKGANLPDQLRLNIDGCSGSSESQAVASATLRRFTCTFPLNTAPGTYRGTIALTDSPFGATPLAEFSVTVQRMAVTGIDRVTAVRGSSTSFKFSGARLPDSGLSVLPLKADGTADGRSVCQPAISLGADGTSLETTCTLYAVGNMTLQVQWNDGVIGSQQVQVSSNVTNVTWVSASTSDSGPVKFGEAVTFTVHGSNLKADSVMGFAVERCGVSNTEAGTATDTSRTFTCLFNNEAGAVAGQMPGVVKDSPAGQVLHTFQVPVAIPAVVTTERKLPHTGVTAYQCYAAGSDTLVACSSPAALALNGQQDGHRVSINAMRYSLVGSFSKEECVKDEVTGLIWEGKAVGGARGGGNLITNYDSRYFGTQVQADAFSNSYGYAAMVNAMALCDGVSGYGPWRLPSIEELQTLGDYGKPFPGPVFDTAWFPNHNGEPFYWTSTPLVGDGTRAWAMYFGYGSATYPARSNGVKLRLVRAPQ